MRSARAFFGFAIILGFSLFGCNGREKDPVANPGTALYGTYTDQSGHAGTVELYGSTPMSDSGALLGQQDQASLDGELRLGGESLVRLKGLYDAAGHKVAFASEDGAYNFNGTVTDAQASGFGYGPGGPATFALFLGGTASSVETFCAVATCTDPPGCSATGEFNVAVSGAAVLLSGSVDGHVAVASGSSSAQGVQLTIAQDAASVTVEGTITGNTIQGTWTDASSGTSGTWTGSVSECAAGSG